MNRVFCPFPEGGNMTGLETNPEVNLETERAEWQERAGQELARLNAARDAGDKKTAEIHEHNLNRCIQAYQDIGRAAMLPEEV